jgi:ribosome recycling factor
VAVLIRQRSLVDNGWLAERLAMGARTAVSRIMREAREHLKSNRKAKAISRRLERRIDQL